MIPVAGRIYPVSSSAEVTGDNEGGFYDLDWLSDVEGVLETEVAGSGGLVGSPSAYEEISPNQLLFLSAPWGCYADENSAPVVGRYTPGGTAVKSLFRNVLEPAPGLDMAQAQAALRDLCDFWHSRNGLVAINQGPRPGLTGALDKRGIDLECKILTEIGFDLVLYDVLGVCVQRTLGLSPLPTKGFRTALRLRDFHGIGTIAECPEPPSPELLDFWNGEWNICTSDQVLLGSIKNSYDFESNEIIPSASRVPRLEYIQPEAIQLFDNWFCWIQRGPVSPETRNDRVGLAQALGAITIIDIGDWTETGWETETGLSWGIP